MSGVDVELNPDVIAMRAKLEREDMVRGRARIGLPKYSNGCRHAHALLWKAIEDGDILQARIALAIAPLRYRAAFALVGFVTGLLARDEPSA